VIQGSPPNPYSSVRWIWMNGRLVEFEKATVHVLTHALHYGSGLFEGIRCYDTASGSAVLRLPEHLRRLENSCKVYRMEIPYGRDQLTQAVFDTILANEFEAGYNRPIIFRGFGSPGINPLPLPVEVVVYDADHAFFNNTRPEVYDSDSAADAWKRVLDLFKKHLTLAVPTGA